MNEPSNQPPKPEPPPQSPFPQGDWYQAQPAYYEPVRSSGPSAGTVVGIVFAVIGIALAFVRCGLSMDRDRQMREAFSNASLYSPSYSSPYSGSTYGRNPTTLELPGMSVKAPASVPITGDYATGSVRGTSPEFAISWQRGSLPEPGELREVVAMIAKTIEAQLGTTATVGPHRHVIVAGGNGVAIDISTAVGTLHMTLLECDKRIIQLMTAGNRSDMDTMTSSFRCTPDPKNQMTISVAVDAKQGWVEQPGGARTILVNARGTLVQPSSMVGDESPLETFIPTAVASAGMRVNKTVKRRGDKRIWTGTMVIDGAQKPAAMVAWACPNHVIGAVYVVAAGTGSLDEGLALAYTGRCLKPGELPPVYAK